MRILYINHTSDLHGSSIALLNLIQQICKDNEVHVLLPCKEGALINKLEEQGVIIHQFKFNLNIFAKSSNIIKSLIGTTSVIIHNFIAQLKLKKLLRSINPDLVHTNVGPLSFAVRVCNKLNIPHIWHIREYQDKDFKMHFIPNKAKFKELLKISGNYNIAITKDIYSHWDLTTSNSKIIYDGVLNLGEIPPLVEKRNTILFVGRISESKGTLEAIKGFTIFHREYPIYKLFLVGSYNSDDYYRECSEYIKFNNLEKKIKFLGERNDIYKLMSESKAIIVSSKSEGFGFITAEAMANHCIVIGKNTGGTKEQFDNGLSWSGEEIGLRYNSIEELAQRLKQIENPPGNMVKAAYDVVTTHYSSDENANQVLSYYKEILSLSNINKQCLNHE